MSHATITTEMCFSDPLRQQLVDSGADAVWPLDDTFGSTVREIVQNLTGTSDDVSRSDAGFIPEYGSVSGFNGTTSTFYVETDAALEPSATVAVAFLVKLLSAPAGSWSLVRKENAGVGGRISVRIVISGADTILRFTANIGATSRDLDYTIADVAAWQATARMIICRYDGTNMQIIQVTLAGVKSTLATAAYSGVVANGTPSRLYVGSNAATDEYANVQLQWLTWWSDDYPTDAELTAMGVALGWTDVSDDVNLGHGLELTYGIQSEGPKARLGDVGTFQFALKNGTNNSAGLLGYYSLDHANRRSGFGFNIPVRLSITDPDTSTVYRKFVGKLVHIQPIAGARRERVTECLAVDYFDELARATLPQMPFAEGDFPNGLTTGEAITKTLQKSAIHPHDVADASIGVEIFPYGYDRAEDEKDVVLGMIGQIIDSELAWCVMRGNTGTGGQFYMIGRQARQTDVTPDWTLSNTMQELEADQSRDEIVTRALVTVRPRSIDAAATTVLFSMDISNQQPAIEAGQFIIIRAPYTDPDERSNRIGGTAIVTPVATTDYLGNSAADGSGTNLTASMAVTFIDEQGNDIPAADAGANSTLLKIANNHATTTLYVRQCQLRGKGVRTYDAVICEASDANLRGKYGDNVLAVSQPFQDSVESGNQAAAFLLSAYSGERTVVRRIRLLVGDQSSDALMTAAIASEPGDLVQLTETVTGLSAKDYFINGVSLRVKPNNAIETEWNVARREMQSWIVGVAGYSEVGETTVLGY